MLARRFIVRSPFGGAMVILVRFGELGLKSPYVRKQLLDRLVGNIQDLFAAEGIECLTRSDRGRVYVDANDLAAATGALRRVFGIVSFSPARETSSEPGAGRRARGLRGGHGRGVARDEARVQGHNRGARRVGGPRATPSVGHPPEGPFVRTRAGSRGPREGLAVRGRVHGDARGRDSGREARSQRARVPSGGWDGCGRGAGARGADPRGVTYLPFRSWAPMLGRFFSTPFPLYMRPRPFRPALVRPRNARPRCWGSQIQLIFGSFLIAGCCGSTRITS